MSFKWKMKGKDMVVILEYLKTKIGDKTLDETINEVKKWDGDDDKIFMHVDLLAKRHFKLKEENKEIVI